MQNGDGIIVIYTTFPSEKDARRIGSKLVEDQLAACVNIFPGMTSIYRWEGALEQGAETAMIIKTRKALQDQVFQAVAALHPYTVPALLAFEPAAAAVSYAGWLHNQTGSSR